MTGIRQWNPKGRMTAMAVLVFTLLLAGCGKEAAWSAEPSDKSVEESPEQTVSAEIDEPETTDAAQETSGQFQYDEKLFALGLPVIEEDQAVAEGKTLLTLQASLVNPWLKYSIAGFNRQSTDYFVRLEETYDEDVEERLSVELMAGRGPDIITGSVMNVSESILKKECWWIWLPDWMPWESPMRNIFQPSGRYAWRIMSTVYVLISIRTDTGCGNRCWAAENSRI